MEPPPSLPIPPAEQIAGNRCSLSPARTARRSRFVERVIGAARQEVVGFVVVQKLRCIRLAENDRARSTKSRNGRRVLLRNVTETESAAAKRRLSRNVEAVFDRDRVFRVAGPRSLRAGECLSSFFGRQARSFSCKPQRKH